MAMVLMYAIQSVRESSKKIMSHTHALIQVYKPNTDGLQMSLFLPKFSEIPSKSTEDFAKFRVATHKETILLGI